MILADDSKSTYYNQNFFPTSAGPNGEHILTVFWPIFVVSVIVFLGVSGAIIYAAFRFRRRDDDEEPEQVHGNNRLELAWTAIPFIVLIALFGVTAVNMGFLNNTYTPGQGDNALFVCVEGARFSWSYYYEDDCGSKRAVSADTVTYQPDKSSGVPVETKLYVPTHRPVQLQIVSVDVNHSFFIPQIAGQVNAIPGQKNQLWLQIDQPGIYHGACTELCGNGHYNMIVEIDALDPEAYGAWYGKEKAKAQADASAGAGGSASSSASASGSASGGAASSASSTASGTTTGAGSSSAATSAVSTSSSAVTTSASGSASGSTTSTTSGTSSTQTAPPTPSPQAGVVSTGGF